LLGPGQLLEQLSDQRGRENPEDRLELRGGEVIAGAPKGIARPPVVAVLGMIQGQLHEAREEDRPFPPDDPAQDFREGHRLSYDLTRGAA